MASITQRVEVCDVCRDLNRSVRHFRLAPEAGRLRKLALCDEHAAPLLDLTKTLSLWTQSGRNSRQVTMEQIEEVKKRQRRGTRKTAAATK